MKRFEEFVIEASGARKPKTKPVTQAEYDRIARETAEGLLAVYKSKGIEYMTLDDCMSDVLARMPNQYKVVKESHDTKGPDGGRTSWVEYTN